MIGVTLLGTGGMYPLPGRALTSLYIRFDGRVVLIDCGEGTQVAIRSAGLRFKPIEAILIYTYVDMNGNFTDSFRIYEIGERCYSLDRFEHAHAYWYDAALQALESGKPEDHVDVLFPRIHGMGLEVGIIKLCDTQMDFVL